MLHEHTGVLVGRDAVAVRTHSDTVVVYSETLTPGQQAALRRYLLETLATTEGDIASVSVAAGGTEQVLAGARGRRPVVAPFGPVGAALFTLLTALAASAFLAAVVVLLTQTNRGSEPGGPLTAAMLPTTEPQPGEPEASAPARAGEPAAATPRPAEESASANDQRRSGTAPVAAQGVGEQLGTSVLSEVAAPDAPAPPPAPPGGSQPAEPDPPEGEEPSATTNEEGDLPDVDLPDVDLPDVDLPGTGVEAEAPEMDLPVVPELPDVELPDVDVPDVNLSGEDSGGEDDAANETDGEGSDSEDTTESESDG